VHKDVIKSGVDAEYDPWDEEAPVQKKEFSFLEEKKLTREPRTLKRAPISMAKSGKPIAAVRKPEKGKSYNPLFEDWQALVAREGDKAVAEEEARLEEEAKEAEKQLMIEKAQAEPEKDGWESEWESEWEGIMSEKEDNGEDKEWLRKKRPERKTPAERNKIKRRKLAHASKIHEGNMKTRELEAARIKQLAKQLDLKIKQDAERTAFPDSDGSSSEGEEIVLRKGLGRAAIPDARLEVVLADELEDSLRRLKPEGNLMQDRFRSMILRGKIESRNKITQPKKPKREVKEKWGYKDWKLK
jgi:nucleolar protein 53